MSGGKERWSEGGMSGGMEGGREDQCTIVVRLEFTHN